MFLFLFCNKFKLYTSISLRDVLEAREDTGHKVPPQKESRARICVVQLYLFREFSKPNLILIKNNI